MNDLADKIDWDKGSGLVPAIIQDADTARVLMLGYMNREALAETLRLGKVTFFGRKKGQLWTKGETSGHFLLLADIKIDCDADTLLVQARPAGPTCHNGTETCFGAAHDPDLGFLGTLGRVIAAPRAGGYVATLLDKGIAKAAQKVGEEGVETALAAVLPADEDFRNEAADLLFHLMVLLQAKGMGLSDVAEVLERRHLDRAG